VYFTSIFGNAQAEYESTVTLTNQARHVIERIAWGTEPSGQVKRRGVMEAVSAAVTANQIDYTDIDGNVHSVRTNSGSIQYRWGSNGQWITILDPNGAPVFNAGQYSTDLTFSQTNAKAVTINLILGRNIQGRWRYASLSTQVFFRNS
jgi:hypothetical protein